jgi:hypothetical protein
MEYKINELMNESVKELSHDVRWFSLALKRILLKTPIFGGIS